MIERGEPLERSRTDARWLFLLCALVVPACEGGDTSTSLLLNVALAPGVNDLPEELRVYVRHDDVALYEDQRLPKAGRLIPVGIPELGSIAIELADEGGAIDVDVFGLEAGQRRFVGRARVRTAKNEQTKARVELVAMGIGAPPPPPPASACPGGNCAPA